MLQSSPSKLKNSGSLGAFEICIYDSNQKLPLTRSVSASQNANSSCRAKFSLMVAVLHSVLAVEDDECCESVLVVEDDEYWENGEQSWVELKFWKVFAPGSVVVVRECSHEFESCESVTESCSDRFLRLVCQ